MPTSADDAWLDRLEGYLRADPLNLSLLEAAFDRALRIGQLDRAGAHLDAAMRVQPHAASALEWRWREAHLRMAKHDWSGALASLDALAAAAGDSLPPAARDALAGDRACVLVSRGEPAAAIATLRSVIDGAGASAALPAPLEQTWLRALHRADRLDDAMAWASRRMAAGALEPSAAGVASLVALDAGDLSAAAAWARHAIDRTAPIQPPIEALVTASSLCLRDADAEGAVRFARQALDRNPDDGRARSVLAFGFLLGGDAAQARAAFESAVERMPDHVGTWHGYAWTLVVLRDLPAARRAFEHAIALDRSFAESHGGLAAVDALRGDAIAAAESLTRARRLDARCASARFAQAVLDGEVRDVQAVRRLAEATIRQARARGPR